MMMTISYYIHSNIACTSAGQAIGAGYSNEYQMFTKAGELPDRHGGGFYIPSSCNYVVDYNSQCGGLGGQCVGQSCVDGPFAGACCPYGYECRLTSCLKECCGSALIDLIIADRTSSSMA